MTQILAQKTPYKYEECPIYLPDLLLCMVYTNYSIPEDI